MRWSRIPWLVGLLGMLPFAACDCAAIGATTDRLQVMAFEVESTDPPADPRGGALVVVPGAHVRLGWGLQAPAEEVILAVDDRVLGTWKGRDDPSTFEDRCTAERCTTEAPKQVTYTLTAVFPDGRIDSRSVSVTVSPNGLQVLTLRLSPSILGAGDDATLTWATAGAVSARIEAEASAGGLRTPAVLATLGQAQAAAGSLPVQVEEPTSFTLVAVGRDGSEVRAAVSTTSTGEAFFTELEVDPREVHPGQMATIRWRAEGVERVSILRDDGAPPLLGIGGAEAQDGAREVEIHGPVSFHLVGTSREGAPVELLCDGGGCRPATVAVGIPARARILHFFASPASIPIGDGASLEFEAEAADELRLLWEEHGRLREEVLPPDATVFSVAPEMSTRFTLYAMSHGTVASTATAQVQVRPTASLEVAVDPVTGGVWAGETTTVAWTSLGADRLQLDVGRSQVDLIGLDPKGGEVEVSIPTLEDGAVLPIVLTAFGTHALETVRVEVQVWNPSR